MAKRKVASLLLLTQSLNDIKTNIQSILEQSFKQINDSKLYIYVNPCLNTDCNQIKPNFIQDRFLYRYLMKNFYQRSFNLNSNIDVNCLMYNVQKIDNQNSLIPNSLDYSYILTDFNSEKTLDFCFTFLPSNDMNINRVINLQKELYKQLHDEPHVHKNDLIYANRLYKNGIVAGTFDRLHVGHKILLSEAALLITKKLLIGITTDSMNKKKTLADLIEPLDVRIEKIKKFFETISPNIELEFAPLIDAFGPSITEEDYSCLIVSDETIKGGELVNKKRLENKLNPLDIHVIDLIDDTNESNHHEVKVSSTKERMKSLGILLKDPYISFDENKPYLIGLTGCISSGKSSVRKRLEKLGAGVIDCDLLGHQTYVKQSSGYKKIVEEFGTQVLDSNKNINRKALGSIVFSDQSKLKKLTDIVWPEIANLVDLEVDKLFKLGKNIIIVEAALLIDAKWHLKMNEIWVCYINEEESIKRTMERDNVSEQDAQRRLYSQLSNKERIQYANVVLATLWEPEYTQIQCEKAWDLLKERTKKNI